MPKYITDQDYCRAKNEAGNTPLWKVYPMETRKLFPFHIFTNFHGSVAKGGMHTPYHVRNIEPLKCGACNEPLNDDYGYYTAYIVFDNATEFYACCSDCKPENSMDFHHQIYGYRYPMTLGPFENSQKHRAVMRAGFSHSKLFRAWDFESVTPQLLKNVLGMNGQGGGTFDDGFIDYNHLHISVSNKKYDKLYQIKPNETVQLVNEIIAWNHANNPNITTPIIPREGLQTTLF